MEDWSHTLDTSEQPSTQSAGNTGRKPSQRGQTTLGNWLDTEAHRQGCTVGAKSSAGYDHKRDTKIQPSTQSAGMCLVQVFLCGKQEHAMKMYAIIDD